MSVEAWYRRFSMGLAAAIYPAAAVELVLVEHYEDVLQIAPFVLIGLGLAALAWAWASPSRRSIQGLRWAGGLAVVGSLVGIGLHVKGNLEFAAEVHVGASGGELAWEAISGGNPLLAPGMIALAGVLAAAATYRHPARAGG